MSFCTNCGKEIIENSKFCAFCGSQLPVIEAAPVAEAPVVETSYIPKEESVAEAYVVEEPVVAPQIAAPAVAPTFADKITEEDLIKEEQEFLDITHRFLCWEKKSWSIYGKVQKIIGIVISAICGLFCTAFLSEISYDVGAADAFAFFLIYLIFFGIPLLITGIVQGRVAEKMPMYIDTLYNDIRFVNDRSGNIGMLVLSAIFSGAHTVFFIVNFTRIKTNKNIIHRILARQGKI